MMDRRTFLTTVAGLLAAPRASEAQQAGKVYRVGWLDMRSLSVARPEIEVFTQAMRELGWAEGKNIAFEFRFAENKTERLPELAVEIVRLKVDLIVAVGTPGVQAAKQATTTIPIVMHIVGDPVESGLVSSLARPGGNVTGTSWFGLSMWAEGARTTQGSCSQDIPRGRIEGSYEPLAWSHGHWRGRSRQDLGGGAPAHRCANFGGP
jgi:ABC transporter substrate binding protein